MRMHESPRWVLPVSLLVVFFLLAAGPALADPHGSMHEHSKGMHASTGTHDAYGSVHHDGMHKKHGGHHTMHSSGHGKHGHKGHGGHGHGAVHGGHHQDAIKFIKHILKFKEGMSLTADQEQKLVTLKTSYKKDRIKTKAEVELASIDLHEVLKNEKANFADIEAEFNKLHALKTKLYMASIKAKRDAKAVLSDEQRTRMDKIHERIKSHGGSMGHPGDYSKYKKMKKNMGHGTGGHMQ
ncbi:MAG: hypothetical protein OXI53_10395 [Nitrospira sp.]|nr:hypothetical protein [Nitrospira sp.]MDE0405709.1 hypothetical protein [Nitrospira sp.]MDE0485609.1 hypothetical protein [Nitrospira sp.]